MSDIDPSVLRVRIDALDKQSSDQQRHSEELRTLLLNELGAIRSSISEIKQAMAESRAVKACPSPGLCLDLRTEHQEMAKQVRELQTWRAYLIGGAIALQAVSSIFLTWLFKGMH